MLFGRQRLIERTTDMDSRPVQDMGIDHRGSYVFMAEQLLHCTNIIAVLKQMRGETVPKSVAACRLSNPGGSDSKFHSVLEVFFRNVMSPCFTGAGIERRSCCRKEILPGQFARSVGVFALQSKWQINFSPAAGEVLSM